ncbi:putative chemotaxis protein Chey [Candidatus Nitrosopumilus salaria BD31]|uniref:Chemotaxis protein Chey n=1 Tax=Candidatus Nitrosopumilus salarius BD31 TaxID=859350 RepID=I3D0I2_9ARCH|nr:response regulator [Candidatus Nitrosopumilus salaria]EIJ65225.1 putative chemotaxis protein Chey [Candidatus Nitrosopumilus salaria BD31]
MNKKGTILVADDDSAVLDTTSTLLELFGFDVVQARNGLETISKYKEHKPGLVFLDVKMPKLDGYRTFFEIEKEFPDAKIIFMTAHADYSEWQKAKSKNALELIEKPYSAEKLKELAKKFYAKK